MKVFNTKEDALEYCFSQIKQSLIGAQDYNILKQYMYRHRKGLKLKDTAISTLFEYFGIVEKCTYELKSDKSSNSNFENLELKQLLIDQVEIDVNSGDPFIIAYNATKESLDLIGSSEQIHLAPIRNKVLGLMNRSLKKKELKIFKDLLVLHKQLAQNGIDKSTALIRYNEVYQNFKSKTGLKR